MKRIFSSFVLLSMIVSCIGVASATDMQQPRASLTLSRYSAVISAGDGSGESIDFYTKDGNHVKSVTGSTRNGLVCNDSIFCAGDYKCSLPSGESYYAEVTVFAEVGSDYDSRTVTTSTVWIR